MPLSQTGDHLFGPVRKCALWRVVTLTALLLVAACLAGCGSGGGSSSGAASVPSITTQPTGLTVTAGSSASFTVVASGSSLTYQWYKDTAAISGATSATYTIASANTSDAGSYYVIVTGAAGTVQSNTVSLVVNSAQTGNSTVTVQ